MIVTPFTYNFPEYCASKITPVSQATKVVGEALEAKSAARCLEGVKDSKLALAITVELAAELLDTIHACETILRKLEGAEGIDLDEIKAEVIAKNERRGYYEAPEV